MQNQTPMKRVKETKNFVMFEAENKEAPVTIGTYFNKSWLSGAAGVIQLWNENEVTFQRRP
jgi:hypothetical protein